MTLDLDPERALALAYVPAPRRAAVEALWRLDAALAAIPAAGREPTVSRLRLAWWREALARLDRELPPAEPVLQALARHVLPAGASGAELATLAEAWEPLLAPAPLGEAELAEYARLRGRLFGLAGRLLGGEAAGGEVWALVDFARHCSSEAETRLALALARRREAPPPSPKPLRPLGMLAMLARRDAERGVPLERQGSPRRMLRMLRHRLTGH